jgi:membrane-bound serine protease (ClpP class)
MTAYLLLAVGLILLWLEFYLPGGAFAVAAGIFVLASLITFFAESTSFLASFSFFIAATLLVIGVIRLAIWYIKRSAKKDTFFLSKDQEGYTSSHLEADIVGKRGVTQTECGPSGYAVIEGKRYPIICRGPYLNKGVEIEVISKELGNYIVKRVR